ncbi:unnamed protein product [Periconia digitata]|uniref:Uncharacterized protein n=1 Tax=Periconia digitata TaxID=1303443 RepID=A0A9W4UK20_9PLEO|nr:unnamed protein product [Periconia digitata]
MVYLRPGFIVVIVGTTLTALSTLVVAFRYFCRYYRMGQVAAADHLIFVALVSSLPMRSQVKRRKGKERS